VGDGTVSATACVRPLAASRERVRSSVGVIEMLGRYRALGIPVGAFLGDRQLAKAEIRETEEVRWFLHPEREPEARDWFESLGSGSGRRVDEPSRVDAYLLTGSPVLGFKGRDMDGQGKLQPKFRVAERGVESFSPDVEGRVEQWCRLSLVPKGGEVWPEQLEVRIIKERSQQRFDVDGQEVSVELTRIRSPEGALLGVTIGLEARGPEADRLSALRSTARSLFAGTQLPLTVDQSMGYPCWLESVFGDSHRAG
jgi:hypothetical protein